MAITSVLLVPLMARGEPWTASVQWERVNGADWLLRDSVNRQPVALAKDPARTVAGALPGIIQGTGNRYSEDLPVVTVHDRLPEFWAQPSVWNSFQRGPSTYAGVERDADSRDWTGRGALDRRAYAFDRGQQRADVLTGSLPVFGPVEMERRVNGLSLSWAGVPGRVYILEMTSSLSEPFQPIQVYGAVEQGKMTVSLSLPVGGESYYRIKAVVY